MSRLVTATVTTLLASLLLGGVWTSCAVGAESAETLETILRHAGWGPDELAHFADDQPPDEEERERLLRLLRRLRTFGTASLERWTISDVPPHALIDEPGAWRGKLVDLRGRLHKVERVALAKPDALRLEMDAYYQCHIDWNAGELPVLICAAEVPAAWTAMDSLDEPVRAAAMFIKRLGDSADGPQLLFLARRIAWQPTTVREPHVSFGHTVLASLGFDVGLFDTVSNRAPILPTERESFFEILSAVGETGPHQLVRFAEGNLPRLATCWQRKAQQLEQQQPDKQAPSAELTLARVVARRLAEGRYSVAPLFNNAEAQVGNLVMLDGVARRAVRIDVGTAPSGRPSDVPGRFGFDHYYELEIFCDDAQNYPVVCCVRELPADFPLGAKIEEPVRVAGFFFKSWLYHVRQSETHDTAAHTTARQFAPLLIGPAPLWLPTEPSSGGHLAGLIGGGVFVAALVGVWLAAWWYARGDREFHRTTLVRQYELPESESLDDLLGDSDDR